jgi:hypothetical protein
MKLQGIAFSKGSARTPVAIHHVCGYVQAAKGGSWVQFKTRISSFTTA